ncbi:ECF RNA polymerase sigma factor SigK [Planctomycetes bacterium Poly30]|uniref:ECF RNA polymerase sigma factor SigK n=1 Tax=Saltatorellus ferox TaxID=2528018 RepID=A0A518EVS9_9BACT|nr:ECF RNA polymerase sigma factor SigK [Planctomycetes bacterium Poly30]
MASSSTFDLRSLALHHSRLRAFVVALVRDEEAADDAMQEVWIRALSSAPKEPRALGAWLRAVARNVVLNRQRSGSRRRFRERQVARAEALPSSADLAERSEVQRRVLEILESLAEPHRTLLRDHYFGGLSIPEIAARSGASVHTLKDRLQRARAVMRRALERAGYADRDTFRWAVVGTLVGAPSRRPISSLIACSFAMKKILVVAAFLLLGTAWILASMARVPDPQPYESVLITETAPAELQPLVIESPAEPLTSARRVAPGAAALHAEAMATTAPDFDWVVRGRVVFSENAGGELLARTLPRVQVRLSAYHGYDLSGTAFATTVVTSSEDGAIQWALPNPGRTVSIRAELLDVPGHDAWIREHHLAVLGEGPVESIFVLVNPRDALVEGTVRASAAASVPGAAIVGARVVYNGAETMSDELGAYRLAVPSRGYGGLIATAEGYRRGGVTPGELSAGAISQVDIVLDPEPGPEGMVFGYVRDAGGSVVSGARVRCWSSREEVVLTDTTGYYELHGIRAYPGSAVSIEASHHAFAPHEALVKGLDDPAPRDEGTQLDFELVSGSRVEGAVTDAFGNRIRGAEVWIGPSADLVANPRVFTDDDGQFSFEHIPPHPTLIGVDKHGLPGHVQALQVPQDGEAVRLSITLRRAMPLRGRVVDEAGAPVPRVMVLARTGAAHESVEVTAMTDVDGRFEIAGAAEGELEVETRADGWMREVRSHRHMGDDLELVVERSSRISGRVVDAVTGDPIEAFTVRFARSDDESHAWLGWIDISWIHGGRTFSSVDGTWSTGEKDLIRRGAWTYVEVEAEGYEVLRLGPLQVPVDGSEEGPGAEWIHELVRP